jgi:hypothetical protein
MKPTLIEKCPFNKNPSDDAFQSNSCCVPQLLREQVQKCYMREGVNSMQNCKDIVLDYLESIKGVGMGRMNSGRYDTPPPKAPLD